MTLFRGFAAGVSLIAFAWLPWAPAAAQSVQLSADPVARPIVVASKAFAESYLLGEMFAQLLEERGLTVRRSPGLGSTEVIFQALLTGAVDVYPEYTGTGLLAILGEPPQGTASEVFRRVSSVFRERWGVRWLPPLGFENTYAITLSRELAEQRGISSISDLARQGSDLVAGFSPDFLGREDGLPGLRNAYGLELEQVRSLLQAVKYSALLSGSVDVIDAYATDGRLAEEEFVVLEDDRGFFPPYQAAALVGAEVQAEVPAVVPVLTELSGLLDEALVRRLNRRIEMDGEPLEQVARQALLDLGLVFPDAGERAGAGSESGRLQGEDPLAGNLLGYLWERRGVIAAQTARHLLLVTSSLAAAILFAVPLGLLLERVRRGAEGVIRAVGVIQTLPSIALLAFTIPLLGVGVLPAVVALFLYSLFPVLRNTYTGVRDADPVATDAASALGMTQGQVLRYVRLPLAAPVIMAGVRTAAVINVGTATLAAFIGAGGLGDPIVSGLALADTRLILSGAIPAAMLAVAVDAVLGRAEKWCSPRI